MATKPKSPQSELVDFLERRLLLSVTPTPLYSFTNGTDGELPQAIAVDAFGDLFGTTYQGGASGGGTVWELSNGSNSVTTLYAFPETNNQPAYPSGITIDGQGNLFGTTKIAGDNGAGSVWELSNGSSSITTLYSFTGGADGSDPAGIAIDSSDNLYGTAVTGGDDGSGAIWKLANGSSAVTTLYSFTGSTDGEYPVGVTLDSNDTIYGTTSLAGANGNGTVWKLANGSNTVSTLYAFSADHGNAVYPYAIALDPAGNLYGTTTSGGTVYAGSLWELANESSTFATRYSFTGGDDGGGPYGLTFDSDGDLFGTVGYGGGGYGALYEFPALQLGTATFALEGQFTGSIPSTAEPEDTLSLSLQITNPPGADPIVDGEEETDYYLSTTPDLTGSTTYLESNDYTMDLDPGNSLTEQQEITIPDLAAPPFYDGIAPGIYYVVAQIDSNQTINPDDANVCAFGGPIQIALPDLTPRLTGVIPTFTDSGDTILPALQITDAAHAEPVVDMEESTVYSLSTTNTPAGIFDQLANSIYELNLDAGNSYTEAQSVTMPDNLAAGVYYLIAQVDAEQTINPADTDNYTASGPIAVDLPVLGGHFSGDIPASAKPGDTVSPGLQITDAMDAAPVINGAETTEYCLSSTPDPSGIVAELGTNQYALNVDAGGVYSEMEDLTIPNDLNSGSYYLVAQIDALQAINPADTNVYVASSTRIKISADLSGDYTTQPTSLTPGDSSTIAFNLTNAAAAASASGSCTVTFQLEGVTPALGNGDIHVGTYGTTVALASGASVLIQTTINIPGNVSGGTYYLAATISDTGGGITDTNISDKTFFSEPIAIGATVSILYTFPSIGTPTGPAGITSDGDGNLFGTTQYGGAYGDGSVWELARGSSSPSTLYSFAGGVSGQDPVGITVDSSGNLYGTCALGGASAADGSFGYGSVWELANGSNAAYTLYSFGGVAGGFAPIGITVDSDGNLYGTCHDGGNGFGGTVWELPQGSSALHTLAYFYNSLHNGFGTPAYPDQITVDSDGTLYGTTQDGGTDGYGSVWELPAGSSDVTQLLYFTEGDGLPTGMAMDSHGNLYGSAINGEYGVAWKLARDGNAYTEIDVTQDSSIWAVTLENDGNLFGTSSDGEGGAIIELSNFVSARDLVFSAEPANTVTNGVIGAADGVEVTVVGALGKPINSSTDIISLSLSSNPGNAILSGTLTSTAVNGVASFDDLSLNEIGNDYRLEATDKTNPGQSETSDPFSVYPSFTPVNEDSTLTIPLDPSGNSVLVTGNLDIAGSGDDWTGKLDITDNAVDIINGSLATVINQVEEGYDHGSWNGSGITSSAAQVDSTHLSAIGVIQNNQSGVPIFNSNHLFNQILPGAVNILVKYTYYGDANLSGTVDNSDYSLIDYAFLYDQAHPTTPFTGWFNGDFNYDGYVNGSDYTLMDNAFNNQSARPLAQIATVVSAGRSAQTADAATASFSRFPIEPTHANPPAELNSATDDVAAWIFAGDETPRRSKLKMQLSF